MDMELQYNREGVTWFVYYIFHVNSTSTMQFHFVEVSNLFSGLANAVLGILGHAIQVEC